MNQEIMEKIHKTLLKRLDKLEKAYTDYQNNPFDKETAHRIRTDSRKLRSMLNFLKNVMDGEEYQKLNGELKKLAMIYGPVREVDILTEWCAEIARRKPGLSNHYKALFNHLGKERRREMRRTFNRTNVQTAESAMETVETGIKNLTLDEKEDWDVYIKKRLIKKQEKLNDEYENADLDDFEKVHETRKRAKKVRFPAKYLGKLSSVRHKKIAKKAEKIQDEFGMITDARTNRRLLENYAEEAENGELRELFGKMAEEQKKLTAKD